MKKSAFKVNMQQRYICLIFMRALKDFDPWTTFVFEARIERERTSLHLSTNAVSVHVQGRLVFFFILDFVLLWHSSYGASVF